MKNISPKAFVEKLEQTLLDNGLSVKNLIDGVGQVSEVEKRLKGKKFLLRDHLRAGFSIDAEHCNQYRGS